MNTKLHFNSSQGSRLGGAPRSGEGAKLGGRLGNATELPTPPLKNDGFIVDSETGEFIQLGKLSRSESIRAATEQRFKLQNSARKTLYGYHGPKPPVNAKGYDVHHRTCTCTRFLLNSNDVTIVHSKKNESASFKGVMACADNKTCPVCAEVINQRKANEMRTAFNQLDSLNLSASMLTFTAPHNAGDKIEDLTAKIKDALSFFWDGGWARRFKKKYGYKGRITSFEVMYGLNGWHPHFHIILFTKTPLPCTLNKDGKPFKYNDSRSVSLDNQSIDWLDILSRWQHSCFRAGLSEPNKHGLDIQDGTAAGSYITKFGSNDEIIKTKSDKPVTWDMADELTKGNTKLGRKSSLSPFGILEVIGNTSGDEQKKYKMLFIHYARALKGMALVKWARGTKSLFNLEEKEVSNDEILQQNLDECDYLCQITPREWKYIVANNLISMVKNLASHGDSDAIARFLFPLYKGTFDNFLYSFNSRSTGNNASVSDNETEWDYIDLDSDIAILDKVIPVQPKQTIRKSSVDIDDHVLNVGSDPLISLAFEKLTKNRMVPKLKTGHQESINWERIDDDIIYLLENDD